METGAVPMAVSNARPGFSIRELGVADAALCREFFSRLDQRDVRLRFAGSRSSFEAMLPGRRAGGDQRSFGAIDAEGVILGILDLARVTSGEAEIALLVRSDLKRLGIGRALLRHAIGFAAARNVSRLTGYVLAENAPMLALAREMGF